MLAQGLTSRKGHAGRGRPCFACAVIRAVASADTARRNGGRGPVAMLAGN
jgi:hypothetical protein